MFVDNIRIHARAGNGGDGSAHFYRGKFNPHGGPDGGDGGKGADIIVRVDSNTSNLKAFFFNPKVKAEHGGNGTGRQCFGKSAPNLIITVPPGTLIYRDTTWTPEDANPTDLPPEPSTPPEGGDFMIDDEGDDSDVFEPGSDEDAAAEAASRKRTLKQRLDEGVELSLVADLTTVGQEFILCKGGKGGKGNVHFKTSTHQAPTEFTPGVKGEEGMFYFELRQIADAGLVGFPNAGKSSLLGKLSAAKPKVAPYRFTTLHPMVGVIEYEGWKRVTVADIPGLIEGAHENVGLGFEFLRHILRCRLLLFVVDMAGTEVRDPCEDVATLRQEISLYDPLLAKRPWLVIANKMDLPESAENLKNFKQRFPRVKILPISAETGLGLDAVKKELYQRVLVKGE
ncbi:MAG: GTPase ObgE [Verrucomicrobiota bacterium]